MEDDKITQEDALRIAQELRFEAGQQIKVEVELSHMHLVLLEKYILPANSDTEVVRKYVEKIKMMTEEEKHAHLVKVAVRSFISDEMIKEFELDKKMQNKYTVNLVKPPKGDIVY